VKENRHFYLHVIPNFLVGIRLAGVFGPQGDLVTFLPNVHNGTANVRAAVFELLAHHRHQDLQPVQVDQVLATVFVNLYEIKNFYPSRQKLNFGSPVLANGHRFYYSHLPTLAEFPL